MITREEIKDRIVEYIKMYHKDGEPIAAEKIVRLLERTTCECPLCHGMGRLSLADNNTADGDYKNAAKELRKRGFTIRQIAQKLGFKHPGSVSHLLK